MIDIKKLLINSKNKYKYILIGLTSLTMLTYFIGYFISQNKFLDNTSINGIDVSKLSLEETNSKLEESINNKKIDVEFINKEIITLSNNDLGIIYNKNNEMKDLFFNQNHWLWFTRVWNKDEYTINNIVSIDENKYNQSINELKPLKKENQTIPKNAEVVYKNNDFSIQKEDNGSTIDTDSFRNIITKAFSSNKTSVNIFDEGGYVMPKITKDDKNLNQLLEASKKYCSASITYQTLNGDIILDGNELKNWLTQDEDGNYIKDDKVFKEKATDFVKKLAKKINNVGSSRTFKGAKSTITVKGGNYGLKVKQEDEVTGLLKDINAHKNGVRKPKTSGVQKSLENAGIGNTFVEVNLTEQKVYYVKDGVINFTTDCVTGKQSDPGRRTPPGIYYIYFMQRNRILRGTRNPDGTWPYQTPVSYWMAFNMGIGLHDANFRSKFGGQIYINSGSHGCVNLPVSSAKYLYGELKVKTPVIVHW